MKKANFTLFQPQRWMSKIGQSALAVLFVLCCMGLQTADAQVAPSMQGTDGLVAVTDTIFVHVDNTPDSTSACYTLPEDTGADGVLFTDDGTDHGNYADTHHRRDTTEICASDKWHYVKVTFTGTLDIEENDTLFAFNGPKDSLRLMSPLAGEKRDTITGQGVSQANGGWLAANCDPRINPSGCITFVFQTDSLNTKGSGWTAWVENEDRDLAIGTVAASTAQEVLSCGESYAVIDIPVPAVTACTETLPTESDSLIIVVKNSKGEECLRDTVSNAGGTTTITDTFALGFYTIDYIILVDQTATKQKQSTITVQAPNLVCNDDVNIPFGSACQIAITPDMILEDPCDTIADDTMNYVINIYLGEGDDEKLVATGTAASPPVLTSDIIRANDISLCGGNARVEIIRTFGDVWNAGGSTVCNNGVQIQSCSTVMEFSDRSAPIFVNHTIGRDTLVACNGDSLETLLNMPVALDNCIDTAKVTFAFKGDTDFSDACVDSRTIVVTYTATDSCMNTNETFDTIVVLRPNLNDHIVDAPTGIEFECGADTTSSTAPRLLQGRIDGGVFTASKDTITLSKTEYKCGYILTSTDITIPAPGCGKKVYRYWSVLDWCAPDTPPSAVDTQFINYVDRVAPVFADSDYSTADDAKLVALDAFDCSTNEGIPTRTATDACAGGAVPAVATDTIASNGGAVVDGKFICGSYEIKYSATDDCGNSSTASVFFTVEDVTPPSAVCTDELIVSIGNGDVRIFPKDIDAGSFDACEQADLKFAIRKVGTTTWAAYVDLSCDDKGTVRVELQVIAPKGKDTVTCWSDIRLEDKIAPICTQLDNATKDCTDLHPDQYGETGPLVAGSNLEKFYNENFGDPFAGCSDNCKIVTPLVHKIDVTKEDCGTITIVRTYSVKDWGNKPSPEYTQTITVNPVHDFKLTFPADQEVKCSDENQAAIAAWDLDQILTENKGCDIFALEVSEREFTVDGDFCKKIERTYEVINWCTYTAGAAAQEVDHVAAGGAMVLNNDTIKATSGRFVYTQIIKYSVDIAPTVMIDDVDPCINADCGATKKFSASAANCLNQPITNFKHNLVVTDANGKVTKAIDNADGSEFEYAVVPGSKYEVEFWGFDDCGNSDGEKRTFTFRDCVRPTPYVLHGIAVEMMQTGSVEVWASDLNRGSFDNCDKEGKRLEYRIALGLPEDGPATDADAAVILALNKNIVFTCDNYTNQAVSFYVIDEAGNWDVVETYILVQDNFNVCGGGDPMAAGRIAGKVTNAFGENVEAVSVSVNGGDNTMTTTSTGQFAFNLALEGDYTITPEKNMNPLNGVSTFDLVLISKHILGLQSFDSPYKYIAADVNKSGSITAFDMVQLRQLILNVTSEFPNNTSWRFVDAKHEFTSENPAAENFDEFMSINDLAGEMLDVNFIAAKIGDVNGTASANSLLGAESRNVNGTLNLNATDRLVEAGQTVTVDFTSADIATVQGYQFTMDFAGLELVELNEGVAKTANFNTNLANRGMLTTSWNGEATANDVLFSLTFTATANGLLSELVSVNSDLTVAEAYNNAGELMNVALDFNASATAAAFGLQQNTPNPFNGETVIGFNLPEAGLATLKVMDIQGKVLTSIERDGVKGYNQVTINARTLSATGVLYYQLESADNIATKKMIIID